MALYDKLQIASYKNVEFLVESSSKPAGKKTVIHSYPNSNKQYVEELGIVPNRFNMVIVISQTPSGNNVLQDLKKIEAILSEPGDGDLVHPIYGTLNNMVCLNFTPKYSQDSVGVFKIDAEFASTWVGVEQPAETVTTDAKVTYNKEQILSDLPATAAGEIIIPETAAAKAGFADKINDMLDTIETSINNVIDPIRENVSTAISTVNSVRDNIYTIMNTTTDIEGMLSDVVNTFINAIQVPSNAYKSFNDMLSFGATVLGQLDWANLSNYINFGVSYPQSAVSPFAVESSDGSIISSLDFNGNNMISNESNTEIKTYDQKVISNNNHVIDEFMRCFALTSMFEIAATKDYTTEDDIDAMRNKLESNFQFQMNAFVTTSSITKDPDLRYSLFDIRYNTLAVLDSKPANKWKLDSINVGRSSVLLQTYSNYGNLDRLDDMMRLNKEINNINSQENFKRIIE